MLRMDALDLVGRLETGLVRARPTGRRERAGGDADAGAIFAAGIRLVEW